jgi:hypothetical protein
MTGLTKTATVNLTNSLPPVIPTGKFLVGDRVKVTAKRLNIYLAPSGKKIGTQFLNVLGTVIDGPVAKGGYTWWNVNFDSGMDGWAIESYLKK